MSASEKLKALDAEWRSDEPFELTRQEAVELTLVATLPQIVAVTSAAEFSLPVLQEYSIDADETGHQTAASQLHEAHEVLYAALSALDQALT